MLVALWKSLGYLDSGVKADTHCREGLTTANDIDAWREAGRLLTLLVRLR